MQHYYYIVASTYGSGAYNTNVYNGATNTNTNTGTGSGSGSSSSGGGGLLTNTGFDIALAVTLACVIVFAALIVRFWKRPAKENVVASSREEQS